MSDMEMMEQIWRGLMMIAKAIARRYMFGEFRTDSPPLSENVVISTKQD